MLGDWRRVRFYRGLCANPSVLRPVKKAFTISNTTSDVCGKCIATGVGVLLAMQVIINIGMTIGLMPVVGIPLPLVSYGGSSLMSTMICVGLLLNVGMRRSTF
ncbi:MAG: FtsW/RodA/SpoVE family cell cycle protein [Candidatus Omnitrophota bacterium]